MGLYARGGSADEEARQRGATHFLEHLLFKRSRRRSGASIARLTDRLGGDCDAYTTKESVAFHARTTAERLPEALDLLFDLTEAPVFTGEDVETERAVILEEMAEANDVPEDRLHDTLVGNLWAGHPLGEPILGTEESVRDLTRETLVERFEAILRPERMVLVAAGAFEPSGLLDLVSRMLRSRSKPSPRKRMSRNEPEAGQTTARRRAVRRSGSAPRAHAGAFHVARPDLTQTHLLIGAPAIPYGHKTAPAAWLATTILGGGVSSRLWRDVRERRGLAYHVGSGLTLHKAAGLALIEAATAPRNLPRLVRSTARILSNLRRGDLTRSELRRAKDQVRGEIALSLESTSSRREAAARDWLYRGAPRDPDEVIAEFEAVTIEALNEAAVGLFAPGGVLSLGVAGPALAGASVDDLAGELAA